MCTPVRLLVLAVALAAATVSAWPGPLLADDKGHAGRRHHVITIDSVTVHPQEIQVGKDDVVVWVNYSGRSVQLRFPESVAASFTCPERPKFYRTGQSVLSRPFGDLEFAMPCRLAPGTYEYSVLGLFAEGEIFDPEQQNPGDPKGKIVVK